MKTKKNSRQVRIYDYIIKFDKKYRKVIDSDERMV